MAKHRKQKKRATRRKKTGKQKLFNVFLTLLLIVGLLLVFNGQIKNLLVKLMSDRNRVENLTANDIDKNKQKSASFDFDAVNSLDFETVVKARLYGDNMAVIGGIAVPKVNLNLPIIKGVSNYSLIVGAGTMKPEQKMGEGNYALASHHMLEADLLFGPLTKVELGQVIYLTDLEYIYEYEIDYKEYVEPTRVDLIEDQPDKTQLTLVTCDETGNQRLIVQATFKEKVSNKKASKKMIKAFNLDKNTY